MKHLFVNKRGKRLENLGIVKDRTKKDLNKNFLIDEAMEEYEMLRAHILSNQDRMIQLAIYMYVTYFAIVAIGVQKMFSRIEACF